VAVDVFLLESGFARGGRYSTETHAPGRVLGDVRATARRAIDPEDYLTSTQVGYMLRKTRHGQPVGPRGPDLSRLRRWGLAHPSLCAGTDPRARAAGTRLTGSAVCVCRQSQPKRRHGAAQRRPQKSQAGRAFPVSRSRRRKTTRYDRAARPLSPQSPHLASSDGGAREGCASGEEFLFFVKAARFAGGDAAHH